MDATTQDKDSELPLEAEVSENEVLMVGNGDNDEPNEEAAATTLTNFVLLAILFSANHGCTVSCLSLATSRLGAIGAWQSGTLYLTYTGSAVLGATYVTKQFGARNAIAMGMGLYCVYVGCFLVATMFPAIEKVAAITGAGIGGIGAGFLWTAQGSYFATASAIHAQHLRQDVSVSTSYLAGFFAFIYLLEEMLMRLLSSALLAYVNWRAIFTVYTCVAVVSTLGMVFVDNYRTDDDGGRPNRGIFYKVTAAVFLFVKDPKMKYMVGLNAVFGFSAAFLNSYVNGEVVDSKYVGVFTAWLSLVAGTMSLAFSKFPRKGPVLILGAACFSMVAIPFIVHPSTNFGLLPIVLVYTFAGIGRATFESTLKATFADYFPQEKEGAFANIILQNGLASAIGYILTFRLLCSTKSTYCVEYRDGSLHNVLTFELLVCITAVVAILGYLKAASLYRTEQETVSTSEEDLLQNDHGEEA